MRKVRIRLLLVSCLLACILNNGRIWANKENDGSENKKKNTKKLKRAGNDGGKLIRAPDAEYAVPGEYIVVLAPLSEETTTTSGLRTDRAIVYGQVHSAVGGDGGGTSIDDVYASGDAIRGAALSNVTDEALRGLLQSDEVLFVEEVSGD